VTTKFGASLSTIAYISRSIEEIL